jgi:hypothetical protein
MGVSRLGWNRISLIQQVSVEILIVVRRLTLSLAAAVVWSGGCRR